MPMQDGCGSACGCRKSILKCSYLCKNCNRKSCESVEIITDVVDLDDFDDGSSVVNLADENPEERDNNYTPKESSKRSRLEVPSCS